MIAVVSTSVPFLMRLLVLNFCITGYWRNRAMATSPPDAYSGQYVVGVLPFPIGCTWGDSGVLIAGR